MLANGAQGERRNGRRHGTCPVWQRPGRTPPHANTNGDQEPGRAGVEVLVGYPPEPNTAGRVSRGALDALSKPVSQSSNGGFKGKGGRPGGYRAPWIILQPAN